MFSYPAIAEISSAKLASHNPMIAVAIIKEEPLAPLLSEIRLSSRLYWYSSRTWNNTSSLISWVIPPLLVENFWDLHYLPHCLSCRMNQLDSRVNLPPCNRSSQVLTGLDTDRCKLSNISTAAFQTSRLYTGRVNLAARYKTNLKTKQTLSDINRLKMWFKI